MDGDEMEIGRKGEGDSGDKGELWRCGNERLSEYSLEEEEEKGRKEEKRKCGIMEEEEKERK